MLTLYYMILISVFTENQHPKWFCLVSLKAVIRFSLVGSISMWVLSQYWLFMTHSLVFTGLKQLWKRKNSICHYSALICHKINFIQNRIILIAQFCGKASTPRQDGKASHSLFLSSASCQVPASPAENLHLLTPPLQQVIQLQEASEGAWKVAQ